MAFFTGMVVFLTGVFLLSLTAGALFFPARVRAFLLGFAGTARLHFLELAIRILIGAAFVFHAPQLWFPHVFSAFGWLLILTSTVMLFIPWSLHQRFAAQSVPRALRFLPLMGLASGLAGSAVLIALLAPLSGFAAPL